jgi:S-DNA-T family DNA segregation ATPase FtsK/SpoIIIE
MTMTTRRKDDYGAVEWLRAHRVEFGPLYAMLPVLALGVVVRLLDVAPALILIGAGALGTGFWVQRARGWRRGYYRVALACALSWLLACRLVTPTLNTWTWLVVILTAATVVLAIPWWADRVRRTHVRMEEVVRAWSVRSARVGLSGTRLTNVVKTGIGWTARLSWDPGAHTPEKVERMRSEIEGALGLHEGQLRMPRDGKSTNSIQLVAITDDPHRAPVPWEIPHTVSDGQLILRRLSVRDELDTGICEDGVRKKIRLFRDGFGGMHVLIGGMTGSGKSGLLNLFWGQLALCPDAVQWGMDLKGGVELGPWRTVFDWIVRTPEQGAQMLAAACAELDRRAALMEKRGDRVWKPTMQDPMIVISVDEAAEILGNARSSTLDMVMRIARQGRAMGIVLILATQFPTVEAIGSTQIREQLHHGFLFRMKSDRGGYFVLPNATVDAEKIDEDRPGTCYHGEGNKVDKMPLRVFFVDDALVGEIVSLAEGDTGRLGDKTETWLADQVSAYGERDIPVQRDGNENPGENPSESDVSPWSSASETPLADIVSSRENAPSSSGRRRIASGNATRRSSWHGWTRRRRRPRWWRRCARPARRAPAPGS